MRKCPALYPDAFCTTQKLIFQSRIFKLFLKLGYIVVIPMLFTLLHQKIGVTLLIFKLFLCRKPGSMDKAAILFVRVC